jgi:hypothetical protein
MYNEYLINKMVDSAIKKYVAYYKKHGSNLDKLEKIQRDLEEHCENKINNKYELFGKRVMEITNTHKLIQNRFDYYFKSGNYYVWQNGNENFKKLLQ